MCTSTVNRKIKHMPDEVFFKLFDDEYFEAFVDKCVERIGLIVKGAR